jgi:hypothetical protein
VALGEVKPIPGLPVWRSTPKRMTVRLFADLSKDRITSQVRTTRSKTGLLIFEWQVSFLTDGTDGALVFDLPAPGVNPTYATGYMDIKREMGGPDGYPVYYPAQGHIPVNFKNRVTT